ncbi:uncharacterized protein LOC115391020 isoform X2 [Salarias fasciatus]|uniref:uncharacterized protein LOC115391020 isoform X2 n=1 Tax=Salarias fasciatus TaxID=181472 RepID=UPI001176D779|nr:uncharacterized protein LOC115391020 isoform X2 [Salarias fasciatus]
MSFSSPELRLVLLGNIGCGKTSSADTILNWLAPVSTGMPRSCQLREGNTEGRSVSLVEAPRWYWIGGKMDDDVKKETERAITMLEPGPHAVLLLVPVSQFTEMEARVPAELEDLFGEDVLNHTLVLLTCGDYLMGKTAEEYLQREHPGLRQMIERCGGRYHVFNNRQRQERRQVRELLEKVDDLVQKHGVFHMKSPHERELERQVKQRKEEILESFRAQKAAKLREIESSSSPYTETLRDVEHVTILERTRKERHEMEERMSNGVYSSPTPERQSYSETRERPQLNRTPSFKLNAVHHRINSFEERSPEASPTSTPHSPVFHPSSSSPPAFTASSSLLSSSSTAPSYLSSSSSSSSSSTSSPELRLILLGRSGAGKSAAGNFILGAEEFESRPDSLTSITQQCEKKKGLIEGRKVAVVDTPDWFNTEQSPDEVRSQISSCVALASPGPHAFLLCVPVDLPAKTELQALGALENVFGPEAVQKHTVVLFTHADRLRASGKAGDGSVEAYIASERGDLLKLVEKCGDRFHVAEKGGGRRERGNVAELLEKVEQTVKEAGGQCYSCPAFQEAENKVRQRQVELAKEKQKREQERLENPKSKVLYSYMQPVLEYEEEMREDEIEKTREEAERSVGGMNIESLPPITSSTLSPSLLRSVMDRIGSATKMLPKLLADSSVLVGQGAKKVKDSPVWGQVGSSAQSVQKMVADSAVWGKVGATAGNVSKAVGDRVPKVVVDGSSWVGSGAKAVTSSPVWGKVGLGAKSGAKIMADSSMRLGAGIGTGAKNLAQSPMWGKVGSGAKSGAKLMAAGSKRVGAGAKKVAQSPVWGKVGSGAKAGVKMVADSSAWERIVNTAKQVPKVDILGAVLGLVLGVFLGGPLGGVIGAAAGSAATEVGRRKLSSRSTADKTDEAVRNIERSVNDSVDAVVRQGGKALKAE